MKPELHPCCGSQVLSIREDYAIVRRLEGKLIVLIGIHQEGFKGEGVSRLTQCVMCATTKQRFDVAWQPFWDGVAKGTIPEANEMETIAVWAHLGVEIQPDADMLKRQLSQSEHG